MLRALARFGEVAVGVFQHFVLIAMAELAIHGCVAFLIGFFLFNCAFGAVLILVIRHK